MGVFNRVKVLRNSYIIGANVYNNMTALSLPANSHLCLVILHFRSIGVSVAVDNVFLEQQFTGGTITLCLYQLQLPSVLNMILDTREIWSP